MIEQLTQEQLKSVFTNADDDLILEILNNTELLSDYYILDTKETYCMFLAQLGYESDRFTALKENIEDEDAEVKYGHTTRIGKILGNLKYGDGYKYKGRGYIQITGRWNYYHIHKLTGFDIVDRPYILEHPSPALISSLEFWKFKELNKPASEGDVRECTKIIQGGSSGLNDRTLLYLRLKSIQ